MSNERALTIVEPAQSPQVVAVSDVSEAEIEFQQTWKEFKAASDRYRDLTQPYTAAHERLVKAWLTEFYPDLRWSVKASVISTDSLTSMKCEVSIDSPRHLEIIKELEIYLAIFER